MVFEAVCEHSQRQSLHSPQCLVPSLSIGHHTGHRRDLSDPATVIFLLELDDQFHDSILAEEHHAGLPRPQGSSADAIHLRTHPLPPYCERLIGTIRREFLDDLVPLSRNHLRRILEEYVTYYNHHRPHSSLGPGIPHPAEGLPVGPQADRHRLPDGTKVVSTPVLGGLHHTYRLEKAA